MTPWQRKVFDALPEPLRRDVKQTCVLGGLLVAFVGVMWFQFGRGPAAEAAEADAIASPTPAAPAPRPQGVVTASTPARSSPGLRVARWLDTPAPALDRNVFLMRTENFQAIAAPAEEAAKPAVRVVEEELFWDELAKSLGARADQKRQRQIWVDNLAAAAGRVRLQTTIMGPQPAALINGRRAGLGEVVEASLSANGAQTVAFRVVQIEPRRIVVERDGLKFEIPMSGAARVIHGAGGGND